jgi:dTDP-glucose pyrophosphorylase
MNIVIPLAGRGIRTQDLSNLPKPLIKIEGKTIIELAIETLNISGKYIFITRKYDNINWNNELNQILNNLTINPIIFQIDYITEGPACSALIAKNYINSSEPLLITNCDQILKWDSSKFLNAIEQNDFDGLVTTWDKISETESFIKLDKNMYGIELKEKKIISNFPLNGIHFWKKGSYFVQSAEQMIKENRRSSNNEFYISESYNVMIEKGYKIKTFQMNKGEHIPIGITSDIKKYLDEKNGNI